MHNHSNLMEWQIKNNKLYQYSIQKETNWQWYYRMHINLTLFGIHFCLYFPVEEPANNEQNLHQFVINMYLIIVHIGTSHKIIHGECIAYERNNLFDKWKKINVQYYNNQMELKRIANKETGTIHKWFAMIIFTQCKLCIAIIRQLRSICVRDFV